MLEKAELTLIIMLSKTKKVITTHLIVLCSVASRKLFYSIAWRVGTLSLQFVPPAEGGGMEIIMRDIFVNGYAYPSISQEVLADWLPSLTFVSCFSYGFAEDGHIIQLEDDALREPAAAAGVKALMVLTPMDETGMFSNNRAKVLLESPAAQENFLSDIIYTLEQKDMFGVDFDFEYVYQENRQQYAQLIGEARQRLNPMGYIVTAALAPKTSADQPGLLYQGHDYSLIGQAANLCLLMTYEWGYTYGPPMAVAPLNAVRRVIEYGLTEIPPEKILMGIPNYGYDWKLPFVKGESKAEKLTNDEAVARAAGYGAEIMFDEQAMSPYYHYTDEDNAEHEVWFEDRRSMEAKFSLIDEYNLAGISWWNIMSRFPEGTEELRERFTVIKV